MARHTTSGIVGRRQISALVALALLNSLGCRGAAPAPPVVAPRFADVTVAAGIARTAQTYDAAVGDFDGDGRLDLYVGNHATGGVLLRNESDGRFVDVLPRSGIEAQGDQHGCGWGDYDNDGRLDLHVSLGAGRGLAVKQNRLYHNEGDGKFRDVGAAAGVADPTGRSRSTAWLDVDRDGWLDLLTVNWSSPSTLFRNRHDGTFEDVSEAWGVAAFPATRLAWTDLEGDGYPDLLLSGTPHGPRLLHNEAGRRFVDWTDRSGLGKFPGSIQGMAFGDYDGDGILDLYVSSGSDFSEVVLPHEGDRVTFAFFAHDAPSGFDFEGDADVRAELYENGSPAAAAKIQCGPTWRPDGSSFRCSAEAAASADPPEGPLGFFLWRDATGREPCAGCPPVYGWHLRWRGGGDHHLSGIIRGARHPSGVGLGSPPRTGGSLWHGRADGGFERVTPRGLEHDANGQAVAWADVNDDGWLDLYVVDSGLDGAGARNLLFVNDGHGGFVRQDASGATPSSGDGRGVGAHFFDFDGDGRQDLFLTNGWGAPPFDRGPYALLRNESAPAHWLDVVLEGVRSNRQGLGARVEVTGCDRRQMRLHTGGANYYSQSAVPPHFGLGTCGRVESLAVTWPSGVTQHVADVPVDAVVRVREPDAASSEGGRP